MSTPIPVAPLSPGELRPFIGDTRYAALMTAASEAAAALAGRRVVHVNSTATGGGVAEMLPTLLGYAAGFGLDVGWQVLTGDPEFFAITKRLHNRIHGYHGDPGALDAAARRTYERVQKTAADALTAQLRAGDIAVLHDPQTLGLAPHLHRNGVITVWRCHIGSDTSNEATDQAWRFLEPFLDDVAAFVFSRGQFRPSLVPAERSRIITPSLDPLTAKNRALPEETARDILVSVGLLQGRAGQSPRFPRRHGSDGVVEHRADVIQLGPPPPPDEPRIVQVSRWDRLKDMVGVMVAFSEHVAPHCAGHLVLAGPNVSRVADDPQGAAELDACVRVWRSLPHAHRMRIHLACLPMKNAEENGIIVNALQRQATVITQKSIAEGFGLTVLEAMWKSKPVVASAVGGIQQQIVDPAHGLLLRDPADLQSFGDLVSRLLQDPAQAIKIGAAAKVQAAEFLPDRHLIAWSSLLVDLTSGSGGAAA